MYVEMKFVSPGDYVIVKKRSSDYSRHFHCANENAKDSPNSSCAKCNFFLGKPCRIIDINRTVGRMTIDVNVDYGVFYLTEDLFTDYFDVVKPYRWRKL